MKNLSIKNVLTGSILFVGIVAGICLLAIIFFDDLMRLTVPENKNIIIAENEKLQKIMPNVNGKSYEEKIFDKSQDKAIWLPLCHEAVGFDDAEDVCQNFSDGYSRKYENFKIIIVRYETAKAAKSAATFLTVDGAMPVKAIDAAEIITDGESYTLVSGKYLITVRGFGAEFAIREIIKSNER